MDDAFIKIAEISQHFADMNVTDPKLLRFLRRYEEAIGAGRNELEAEVRASDDPTQTMRAWIKTRMADPLMAIFVSEDPNVQFPLDNKNIKTLERFRATQDVVVARKIDRAKEWQRALSSEVFPEYPEFVYTVLRDIFSKHDKHTTSPPPPVDTGILGGMFEHFEHTAEDSQKYIELPDTLSSVRIREEHAQAEQEMLRARATLEEVRASKPAAEEGSPEAQAWTEQFNQARGNSEIARRRFSVIQAQYSSVGSNMYDVYHVVAREENINREQENAQQAKISGRWKKIPQIGEMTEEFPNDGVKTRYVMSMFAGGVACLKQEWGFSNYAGAGPLWILTDDAGTTGLVAVAIANNRPFHMQTRQNQEPFGYEKEIKVWMDSHPEYDFDAPVLQTGHRGQISLRGWMQAALAIQMTLTDPEEFVPVGLSMAAGDRNRVVMNRIVALNERDFNRYVKKWFDEKMERQDIRGVTRAIMELKRAGIRQYAALQAVIEKLGEWAVNVPDVLGFYMEYVREFCERIPSFENAARLDLTHKAVIISHKANCVGSLTPELRQEILGTEGLFDEYIGLNTSMPITGTEVMYFIRQLHADPRRALQIIMKMNRNGTYIDGLAPVLVQLIRKDPQLAVTYALYVKRDRFKEGEEAIAKDRGASIAYITMLAQKIRSEGHRWERSYLSHGLPPALAAMLRSFREQI
jgi:hypothetical protein